MPELERVLALGWVPELGLASGGERQMRCPRRAPTSPQTLLRPVLAPGLDLEERLHPLMCWVSYRQQRLRLMRLRPAERPRLNRSGWMDPQQTHRVLRQPLTRRRPGRLTLQIN